MTLYPVITVLFPHLEALGQVSHGRHVLLLLLLVFSLLLFPFAGNAHVRQERVVFLVDDLRIGGLAHFVERLARTPLSTVGGC